MSACWMTIILLAITFLVFYALGMSAYRRQPVVIIRCNDTKPAGEVFYHHIVPREAYVPFALFTEYLSYMAKQYPLLRFNVYFLINDSQGSRHSKFIRTLVPHITGSFNTLFDQNYHREIKLFQNKYQNVNITVMYLSKYMAMTPFRYKWRSIPSKYLPFYARVYAIWQYGGIGFDLANFNNEFNKDQTVDRRVDAILRQHNDGFDSDKYADVLRTFDNEEQSDIFSMFFNLVNQIFNETCFFFNSDLPGDMKVMENSPVVRTHRSKRNVKTAVDDDTSVVINNTRSPSIVKTNSPVNVITNNTNETSSVATDFNIRNVSIVTQNKTNSRNQSLELIQQHGINNLFKTPNLSYMYADIPQVFFFYDFSGFSDDVGPSYFLSKNLIENAQSKNSSKYRSRHAQNKSKYLTITPDGHFMAASSHHHPFLAQLFSAGCQRISPKYAIKNTLLSQCSGFLRDDVYCENINVINIV